MHPKTALNWSGFELTETTTSRNFSSLIMEIHSGSVSLHFTLAVVFDVFCGVGGEFSCLAVATMTGAALFAGEVAIAPFSGIFCVSSVGSGTEGFWAGGKTADS